jgi:hemoglobin-like flavoprotein
VTGNAYLTPDELAAFHSSLSRCVANDGFLERFYFLFTTTSPSVAHKFQNTDWLRQRRMLVASFYMMMAAEEEGTDGDPHLERIARIHGPSRLNIPAKMYDDWLESLMRAVSEYDPAFSPEIDQLWRRVMTRGIAYMKDHSTRGSSGRTLPRIPLRERQEPDEM